MPTLNIPVRDTAAPGHAKPVILVADADPELRRRLTSALKRRFGSNYQIRSAMTPTGHENLRRLRDAGTEVARIRSIGFAPSTEAVVRRRPLGTI